ncbi:MAG TPA: G8 domain-containing protein [Planctomycetota bacterium]|nr:G8 domain-containing protein [Planctomycetota bacterium]
MVTRAALLALVLLALAAKPPAGVLKSSRSGSWSDAATWEGGAVPPAGSSVLIRAGHTVVYDRLSDQAIRSIHISGALKFATDRDTRLDVGLIKVQPGEECVEDGFNCEVHLAPPAEGSVRPLLEVGSAEQPVAAGRTARIRLVYFDGMDKETCPAIISCAGQMEFHGAPMNRTWLKLGATARAGDSEVALSEPVSGWRAGDKVIVTATKRDENESGTRRPGKRNRKVFTEERTIQAVEGTRVTLDAALQAEHLGAGETRGEIANLSRNVIVESAEPERMRGHTMYHRHSAGSISYAEFRHLGKENVLGKYSLHFHLLGSSMRGASVVGASIWDSANRWVTIHGTNYLVVRDCVGYQSVGHGFFLEDGTEAYNVLDRNLAVQSYKGKKLPKQVLPFDQNEGSGFWWANNLNSFTRNVSCENDRYGYRFEASPSRELKLTMPVLQPDGRPREVDIRTLPFVRFEDNESHSEGLYGFNLGEGVDRVGPDVQHPLIVRNLRLWDVHYAFRPEIPSVLAEDVRILRAVYGVYHPDFNHHVYRRLYIGDTVAEPFNRGHDDDNVQYGPFTVDGLVLERCSGTLIQVSQHSPTKNASAHFRAVEFRDNTRSVPAYVDTTPNGQPKDPPPDDLIPYYFHDWYGPGRTAKLLTAQMVERANDGLEYREGPAPFLGRHLRMAEARDVEFPDLLSPVDDLPPATIITSVSKGIVRGTTADNGAVKRVLVNGQEAKATAPNFAQWEIALGDTSRVEAWAEDAAGNVETNHHVR